MWSGRSSSRRWKRPLATATRKRYKEDVEVRVTINRQSGDYEAFRRWEVLDDESDAYEFMDRQILLSYARQKHPEIRICARD